MIKYIMPKDINTKPNIFRNISIEDSILFISGMLIMVLILSSNLKIRFGLSIMVLALYIPLFVRFNGERLYVNLIYILRYFVSTKLFKHNLKEDRELIYEPYEIKEDYLENNNGTYTYILEVIPRNITYYKEEDKDRLCMCFQKILEEMEDGERIQVLKYNKLFNPRPYLLKEKRRIYELKEEEYRNEISKKEYDKRLDISSDRIFEIFRGLDVRFVKGYALCINTKTVIRGEDLTKRIQSLFSSISFESNHLKGRELKEFVSNVTKENLSKNLKFGMRDITLEDTKEVILNCVDYPEVISTCFLENIFNIDGVEVSVCFTKENKEKVLRKLDGAILNLNSPNSSNRATEEQKREITEDGYLEMLDSVNSQDESVLNMKVFVSKIYEKDEKVNIKELKRELNRNGFVFRECSSFMKEAFLTKRLGNKDVYKRGRIITSGIGGCTFPFSTLDVLEDNGVYIGNNEGGDVYIDFFKRDMTHLNSNMVIIGKSGSGKSYASKALITQVTGLNTKVFILDPEGEYENLSTNLGGVSIDTSDGENGRINPFEIFNKEDGYVSKLRFLEEFYKTTFTGLEEEHIETLNKLSVEVYKEKGIDVHTDITKLKSTDYPTFGDLFNFCMKELEKEKDSTRFSILRTILTYLERVKDGNRDSSLWNGYTTITSKERIISFNFKKLIMEGNRSFANAEMLLVLHYVLNKISEYRDKEKERVVVVVDEAHLFVDEKYPVALDFMFQLAKRIRKYNGMQIIITQNLKDFVGSREIIKKTSAIINVSQYTMLFSLSPGDVTDLMKLYENAGGITEEESTALTYAERGDCLLISSPRDRELVHIEALDSARLLDMKEIYYEQEEESRD